MSDEQLTVYIDPDQIKAQKDNKYDLFLAKKVNGQFTVVWQSKGAQAAANKPSYEYQNKFDLSVLSFCVNYVNNPVDLSAGSSFTSSGQKQSIELGQTVILNADGLFETVQSDGKSTEIVIHNQLQANPHEVLMDQDGNPIFVNTTSGMDVGDATLTPIDTYQVWFGSQQDTGTIIADNRSNIKEVQLEGGQTKIITYTADGTWADGAPAS
ncbi:MAG: hypothetical protein R3C14_43240 [Caldilineaceae bacterium]